MSINIKFTQILKFNIFIQLGKISTFIEERLKEKRLRLFSFLYIFLQMLTIFVQFFICKLHIFHKL